MAYDLYIVWTDKNCTGIPIIDEQYRSIVAIINSLHYFMKQKRDIEVLAATVEMMIQYSIVHFKTEEAILSDCGYPALDEHMQLHRQLIDEIKAVDRGVAQSAETDSVLKLLKEWWLYHINVEDQKYVPFVIGKRRRT